MFTLHTITEFFCR